MACFIAGNFIYIALSDMLPIMSKEKNCKYAIFQILALCFGIGIMYLILLAEEDEH